MAWFPLGVGGWQKRDSTYFGPACCSSIAPFGIRPFHPSEPFRWESRCSRFGISGLGWQQAETLSLPNGVPVMALTGQCKTALEALTPDGYKAQISISLSDEPPYALAFVIINAVPLKMDTQI